MPMLGTLSLVTTINTSVRPATASIFALSDDNSTAAFDPDFSENPSNHGLLFWTVDNVNQLFQDSFWYRTGNTSGEKSINSLDLLSLQQSQPSDNKISALYVGLGFEIGLDITLDGGNEGSGASSLFEDISVTNTSAETLDFHLFNYTDYDLSNSGERDTTTVNPRTATQQDDFTIATSVAEPTASYYQAAAFPDLIDALEDDSATTLENLIDPLKGDTDFAFQWDFTLDPVSSFSINNLKSIAPRDSDYKAVPEPTATAGFIAFICLLRLCSRNKPRTVS